MLFPCVTQAAYALYALTLHNGPEAPQNAIENLAQLSLPVEKLADSALRLTWIWADQSSPAAVAAWADQAADNPLFPTVTATLAQLWSYENGAAAGQWLNAHSGDPLYLPALKAHLAVTASQNPASAHQWVQTVSNPANRAALITELKQLDY